MLAKQYVHKGEPNNFMVQGFRSATTDSIRALAHGVLCIRLFIDLLFF